MVNCGVATMRSFFDHKVVHNLSWYIPGYLALGDTTGLVELIAPLPLYLLSGERDPIFPLPGVEAIVARATELYRAAGQADAFRATLFDGAHSFPASNRQLAYEWLGRWLST